MPMRKSLRADCARAARDMPHSATARMNVRRFIIIIRSIAEFAQATPTR
jgi:hypothetical protein